MGPAPSFPDPMEASITRYVQANVPALAARSLLSAGATAIAIPATTSSMAARGSR
jgi:hypothetical protein